jgi:hypothetical protein
MKRALRMCKALATDKRVPRGVRPLIVFGLLPLPWILDEMALVLAATLLFFMRPGLIQILWQESK